MKYFTDQQAYENLKKSIRAKTVSMPNKDDTTQYDGVGFLPKIQPKFKINKGDSIFTIGSCFAREIEGRLPSGEYDILMRKFSLPEHPFKTWEWGTLEVSHLLNEYNVGTISQRVIQGTEGFSELNYAGAVDRDGLKKDLLLHIWSEPKSEEMFTRYRNIIDMFYRQLRTCNVVIITLGLIECWYDTREYIYLNTAPSQTDISKDPFRYEFRQMQYDDVEFFLNKIIKSLNEVNPSVKIILTVSPVPLEATFSGGNAILASYQAKAILRASIDSVVDKYENVDYFPSYEIVQSRGCAGFQHDNTHVDHIAVNQVFEVFKKSFLSE